MTLEAGVISSVSVAHDRADVATIEAARVDDQPGTVETLLAVPGIREAYVLQTCNRAEAYVVTEDPEAGQAALAPLVAAVPEDAVVERGHEESLRHLLRVACGLESLVLGEDQILGQVRDAYADARAVGGIGPVLSDAVPKATHVGERARTETAINEGAVSLGSAAVRLAAAERGSLEAATALVVGAGEMGRLAASALAVRVDRLLVANRTPERAATVAEGVDGDAESLALADVPAALDRADVVVTATGSPEPVLDAATFEDCGETFVVDLARPRDVPAAAADRPGVTVRDLDAIETVTDETRSRRAAAAEEVEAMVEAEFEHLLGQYKRKRADRVIGAMYESAERVKARELRTAFAKLDEDDLSEEGRAVVESMADALVSQLLAAPTRSLRDAAENDDWTTINSALRLFDPDFGGDAAGSLIDGMSPDDLPAEMREAMPTAVLEQLDD